MSNPELAIKPYILAGGRSSRMGQDKAMLQIGGVSLLSRAVNTLRTTALLKPAAGSLVITVVGEQTRLEGADRKIIDFYSGRGPLGGMEAALRDLSTLPGEPDWALFLPVDMPFLSPAVLDKLLGEWRVAVSRGALVCFSRVDDTPQPLVSLVHRKLESFVRRALDKGDYKVVPVLKSACVALASDKQEPNVKESSDSTRDRPLSTLWVTPVSSQEETSNMPWFTNLNTPEDLNAAETFAHRQG